jgi:HSP20 family protein
MSLRSLATCGPVGLVSYRNDLDCLFDDLLNDTFKDTDGYYYPAVNIAENKGHIEVTTELPGMKKEDIKVEVRDNVLYISGEKKRPAESKDRSFYRIEQCYGKFDRRIELPLKVDTSKIEAEYKDGILNITLPITEAEKQIEVEIK